MQNGAANIIPGWGATAMRLEVGWDKRFSDELFETRVFLRFWDERFKERTAPMPKPKLTTARYAERFAAAKIAQQRRYCDAFGQWRRCDEKRCRRDRACRGDAGACLKRAVESVPREVQSRVRTAIVDGTPANLGGPERTARGCTPLDFYDGAADRYAAQEIERLRRTGKIVRRGDNAHSLRLRLVDARR
jgi:hypothetical protein